MCVDRAYMMVVAAVAVAYVTLTIGTYAVHTTLVNEASWTGSPASESSSIHWRVLMATYRTLVKWNGDSMVAHFTELGALLLMAFHSKLDTATLVKQKMASSTIALLTPYANASVCSVIVLECVMI